MRIEKELKRGEKFDLISFDIFDTLIERDVLNPKDIFYLAGLELFKDEDEAKLFRERRIKAESEARKKSDTGEVSLKDIYRELFAIYGINAGILRERELALEVKHCKAREDWKTLLEAFVRSGKRVMDEKKHKDEELQTRREFFKKAAQKVLPMLGAIVVGPSFITSTLTSCEKCDGCESTCSDDCTTGCSGGCSGLCLGHIS